MIRSRAVAGVLVSLLLAACGGSTTHTTSSTPSPTTSALPTTLTGPTSTSYSATVTATLTSTQSPPEVSKSKAAKHRPAVPEVSTGVRFPAAFTVAAGPKLTPPSISGPAGATVALTLANHDSSPHVVTISVPHPRTYRLEPGATASAAISGLRDGAYRILIDGIARGQMVIGAQGGP